MLTVDAPAAGQRPCEMRAGFALPEGMAPVSLLALPEPAGGGRDAMMDAAPRWADLEWLCAAALLPMLVKGILHPADTLRAVTAGLGWGLLPEQLATPGLLADDLVELSPELPLDVPLYWQHWKLHSPDLDALTDAVLDTARAALRG